MIIWSGRGVLSVLVLILSFAIFASVFPKGYSDIVFVLSFLIAALFSWYMGKKWNSAETKTLIDKETGQEVILKPNHSLFWIPMQYWGPIFAAHSLIILVQMFF